MKKWAKQINIKNLYLQNTDELVIPQYLSNHKKDLASPQQQLSITLYAKANKFNQAKIEKLVELSKSDAAKFKQLLNAGVNFTGSTEIQTNLKSALFEVNSYIASRQKRDFTELMKFQLAVDYLAMIKSPEHFKYMDRYKMGNAMDYKFTPNLRKKVVKIQREIAEKRIKMQRKREKSLQNLSETSQQIQFDKHKDIVTRDISLEKRQKYDKNLDQILFHEDNDYVFGSADVQEKPCKVRMIVDKFPQNKEEVETVQQRNMLFKVESVRNTLDQYIADEGSDITRGMDYGGKSRTIGSLESIQASTSDLTRMIEEEESLWPHRNKKIKDFQRRIFKGNQEFDSSTQIEQGSVQDSQQQRESQIFKSFDNSKPNFEKTPHLPRPKFQRSSVPITPQVIKTLQPKQRLKLPAISQNISPEPQTFRTNRIKRYDSLITAQISHQQSTESISVQSQFKKDKQNISSLCLQITQELGLKQLKKNLRPNRETIYESAKRIEQRFDHLDDLKESVQDNNHSMRERSRIFKELSTRKYQRKFQNI